MSSNTGIGQAATFNFSSLARTKNSTISLPKDDLYVDTNSWVDVALGRSHGQKVEGYLQKFVAQQGTPIILWSPHNTDELMQCIQVDEYRTEAVKRGLKSDEWKQVENTASEDEKITIHKNVLQRFDSVFSIIKESVFEISNSINVGPTTREIMVRYGVPYKDAKHLAYMWHEETNNLLTRDKGFRKIPGLNIYSSQIQTNGVHEYSIEEFMPDLPKSLKWSESKE